MGGAIGAQPPPLEKWRLWFSGGFQPPTGAEPPPPLRIGKLAQSPLNSNL